MDLDVKLKPVKRSDIRFLYNQLKERDSTINISHKKIPSYAEHSKFVLSRPYYTEWAVLQSLLHFSCAHQFHCNFSISFYRNYDEFLSSPWVGPVVPVGDVPRTKTKS